MMNKITTIEKAIEKFEKSIPEFMDFYRDDSLSIQRGRSARFREFDEREFWDSPCPEYEHDCWREKCGEHIGSGRVGAIVEVFDRKGNWTTVAEWNLNWQK